MFLTTKGMIIEQVVERVSNEFCRRYTMQLKDKQSNSLQYKIFFQILNNVHSETEKKDCRLRN